MTRRPFILRRPFISALLALLVILITLVWSYRVHLAAFPGIFASYTAKEYCSCRYVMNDPAEYCLNYAKLPIAVDNIIDDPVSKQVTATKFGSTQRALWLGPREGCRLQP